MILLVYLACPVLHRIDAVPVKFFIDSQPTCQTGDLTSAFAKKTLSLHQCVPNHKHQRLSKINTQVYIFKPAYLVKIAC